MPNTEYFESSLSRPFGLGLGRRDKKCVIKDVVDGGNGERAGFMKGDVIVRMNDYTGETYEDFMAYMGAQPKHLSTQIVVLREVRGKALGLQAIVSGAMNVAKSGSRFTVYRLAIRNKARQMWTAHKRYSEFEALHAQCGKGTSAVLPGKTLFGKNDSKVILDRMEGLNEYLATLLKDDKVVEHPALAAFLAKDQPLIAEENVFESWDAEWAGAFLGKEVEDPSASLDNSFRRKMMMEQGKKSAQLLDGASGKLSADQQNIAELDEKKSALHARLMEVSGDLQVQITEVETNCQAMTDLVNAINVYEIKINGEFNKSSTQLKTELKKDAGRAVPRKRLEGEVSEITVKIASTKEGIVKLKEMKVSSEDEGEANKKALQLEIDQVTREKMAQERLLDNVKANIARMTKEIDDTRAGLESLEGDSGSMNAYFQKMETEAADLKAQLDKESENLESLEGEEKSLQAQQDAVQGEHTTQLQEQESLLGALRELADLRDGHAASLRGLRQMSNKDTALGELVDQELERLSGLRTHDENLESDAAAKREAVLHAIKESETKFVEALKEVRTKINAQKSTLERLSEYFTKVKEELEYATKQLQEHNCERANLDECSRVLGEELAKAEEQGAEIRKLVKIKQLDEAEKIANLENVSMELAGQLQDVSEQIEAETQVLEGLQEYLARTKLQLSELDGSREDKGKFKLLEQCASTFGSELKAIQAEHETRKASLEELEGKEKQLKAELSTESAKLAKEEREMAYKITVDSRAMGLKKGYSAKLESDVKASGVSSPAPAPSPAPAEDLQSSV